MGLTIGPKIITENLVLHFDSGNPLGWNNTTGEWHNFASNTVGGTRNSTNITYNSTEDALFFPNNTNSDGLVINDINYVTGASDQVSNLTLEAWVKVSSETTTHSNDQRIILSYDRSSVYRFCIGSDSLTGSDGKISLNFTTAAGTFDLYAATCPDLRDDNWHQVGLAFTTSYIDWFLDGEILERSTGSYGSISDQDTTETPRYGIIGNGSESTSPGSSVGPTDNFFGYIKSLKQYDGKTFTADEIKHHYNAQKARYGL
jgi:hypothetical protein